VSKSAPSIWYSKAYTSTTILIMYKCISQTSSESLFPPRLKAKSLMSYRTIAQKEDMIAILSFFGCSQCLLTMFPTSLLPQYLQRYTTSMSSSKQTVRSGCPNLK